ncbi:MAG: membrane dipeptidase [Desulfobacterales bacterium]|nr:membrane dipeptidase [Desulfobacterales bacterium]
MDKRNSIPICDLHCDTAMKILGEPSLGDPGLQVNISKMEKGNVLLQVFACYVPTCISEGNRAATVLRMMDNLEREIASHGGGITVLRDADAAAGSVEEGAPGCIFGIENGMAIESDLGKLEMFYERGVRLMTIVHSQSHDWAISSNDKKPAFDGLTGFGEKVIAAMNEMGMIVDLSHCHDLAAEKVLSIAKKPVVASHSCAKALCDIERNMNDSLIKAVADNGGMIGVNFFPGFLDMDYYKTFEAEAGGIFGKLLKMEEKAGDDFTELIRLYERNQGKIKRIMADKRVSMDKVVEHIDYIVSLVGDDFVGFGSDFDGIPDSPVGLEDCTGFPLIVEKLAQKGYKREQLEKICYKNFLRVFGENE